MELTYHGYATVELTTAAGERLLIDPWIEDNPHCKASVEEFADVSAILVTHGAFDHLGDAVAIATAAEADIHCDFASMIHLLDEDIPNNLVNGYIWGMEINQEGWSAKVVEARHLSMFWREGLIGPALAFIITVDGERVYHMGDTCIFRDIELYGELYEPTISFIPVGRVEGYLTELHSDEAALAAQWLASDVVVPMHYRPDSEAPQEFHEECRKLGVEEESDIKLLEPGSSLEP